MATNDMMQTRTTPLGATQGGTGLSSTTINQILYVSSSTAISGLATANSQYLLTNGSGVPGFSSSLPSTCIQSADKVSWTPADASPAGLTLTINSAIYSVAGNMLIFEMSVTYPSTADTNQAQISGLPYNSTKKIYLQSTMSTTTTVNGPYINAGASIMNFIVLGNPGGATVTNANLSTGTVKVCGAYQI